MDLHVLLDHLEAAEQHVAIGEELIAKQHEIIDRLTRQGRETDAAQHLLRLFLQTQLVHIADRDRLEAALRAA